jgi:hypothetical protein
MPSWTYPFSEDFSSLVSDYEGEGKQVQSLRRFPKRGFNLAYQSRIMSTDWLTLHNFFRRRRGGGEPFWFFDFQKRIWVDEYVGRGGPFDIDAAISDDGGVQTDETDAARNATTNDMTLLPAVPAQNDAYYFGAKIMFDKLTVTIGTQGVGTWTVTWEYWNGSAWTALSGVTDGTTGFTAAAGDHDVTFTIPSNWADCEVSSKNYYWIRARVSAYTSVTTQPKGTKTTYNTLTYDLPSKTTTSDATLIAYIDGVACTTSSALIAEAGGPITTEAGGLIITEASGIDYTFVSGGGGGGADRITFTTYPTTGSLITADFEGYLRIKATMPDKFSDDMVANNIANIGAIRISEW